MVQIPYVMPMFVASIFVWRLGWAWTADVCRASQSFCYRVAPVMGNEFDLTAGNLFVPAAVPGDCHG